MASNVADRISLLYLTTFPLLDASVVVLANNSLYIRSMRVDQFGMYVCVALNEAGSHNASTYVTSEGNLRAAFHSYSRCNLITHV